MVVTTEKREAVEAFAQQVEVVEGRSLWKDARRRFLRNKAALTSLTQTAGLELAPYGVRCNLVSPGSTRTPMLYGMWQEGEAAQRAGAQAPQSARRAPQRDRRPP